MHGFRIITGDALWSVKAMSTESVDCCITSPPYWGLRDYGHEGQMGLESTPEAYVVGMVELFREVRRVLKPTGTLWLNLGDSYAGSGKGRMADGTHSKGGKQDTSRGTIDGFLAKALAPGLKPKDLVGIPWRVAFALQADGWYLRQDIIWHKPNPMPESVTDRCTKAHEYLFLLAKSNRYFYNREAMDEPATYDAGTRNRRDVWTIPTKPYRGAHFAVMPEALVEPCVLAGCPVDGLVLDPFTGSGTVGVVAVKNGRNFLGIELNPKYAAIADNRIRNAIPPTSLFNPSALAG